MFKSKIIETWLALAVDRKIMKILEVNGYKHIYRKYHSSDTYDINTRTVKMLEFEIKNAFGIEKKFLEELKNFIELRIIDCEKRRKHERGKLFKNSDCKHAGF